MYLSFRVEWWRWREHMGLYVSCLLSTCRFNITYLRAHVTITGRLLLKLCRGESLSIKERKLLSRTTAELLRISPCATNIILPSLEFMLPHFHTLFRILPSPLVRKVKQQVWFLRYFVSKFFVYTIDYHLTHNSQKLWLSLFTIVFL